MNVILFCEVLILFPTTKEIGEKNEVNEVRFLSILEKHHPDV